MSAAEREYTATFFTHFDAICFSRELAAMGVAARLMPVPRRLSSSCGTCVRFAYTGDPAPLRRAFMEQLAERNGEDFRILWDNR